MANFAKSPRAGGSRGHGESTLRVRARMTARRGAIGFAGRRSHEVVDVDHCLALEPALDAALQEARRALGRFVGEEGSISGLVRGSFTHPLTLPTSILPA